MKNSFVMLANWAEPRFAHTN